MINIKKTVFGALILQGFFLLWLGAVPQLGAAPRLGAAAVAQEQIPGPGSQSTPIPKEPGWKDPTYRGWELLSITGLIGTYYDLNLDGKLDYMVIRKIQRRAAAEEVSIERAIEIARAGRMSVYISNPVIYFTNQYPMFYCLDVDFRRNCTNIWVDVEEDGLNGNEVLYSPSSPKPMVR